MHRNGKNIRRNKDWIQGFNYNERLPDLFKCYKATAKRQWWNLTRFQIVSGSCSQDQLRNKNRWREKTMDWKPHRFECLHRIDWSHVRNWNKIRSRIGWKKKDSIIYEFDKSNNSWKFNGANIEVLEVMMIDKYHRTHEDFMKTPLNVIQTILLKRESDSKSEKKKKNSLQIKKR